MTRNRRPKRPSLRTWLKRLIALRQRGRLPMMIRGRRFTYRGLRTVMRCVADHYAEGRTRISEVVCTRIGWRQPNGWLKDRACRDALLRLERLRVIKLPPRFADNLPKQAKEAFTIPPGTIEPVVVMPETITLEWAKSNPSEQLWNALVENYHYLGHKIQVGRCLKYLIRGDGQLLGAISFSSPAWKLAVRDTLLKQMGMTALRSAHDFVINNSRFLILPQVRVPHLASRVLALATRQVLTDWTWYYSIEPRFVETFVEGKRKGTCYKAANWTMLGMTNGYAKVGASHHNSQRPKKVFFYGLNRNHRRKLRKSLAPVPSLSGSPDIVDHI
jgi:hypothetical protein